MTTPVNPVVVTSMFDDARVPGVIYFALYRTVFGLRALILFLVIASEELARFLRVIPSLNFSSSVNPLSSFFITPPTTSASIML